MNTFPFSRKEGKAKVLPKHNPATGWLGWPGSFALTEICLVWFSFSRVDPRVDLFLNLLIAAASGERPPSMLELEHGKG